MVDGVEPAQSMSKAASRASFIAERAPELASAVCAGVKRWHTTMPLSKRFGWFANSESLVVVGTPVEAQRDLDLGLAFGLAHAVDRELVLVVPKDSEEATRRRLPWIDAPVSLYTFDSGEVVGRSFPLARAEVLGSINDPLVTSRHDLGDAVEWVDRLTRWATGCPELVAAHRPSYLAWHCRGRLVLRIQKKFGGVNVSAGKHSSGTESHHCEQLNGRLSAEQFHRLVSAASVAIADRLGGADVDNAEHELQEKLAAIREQLALLRTVREFPAMRPVNNRGFIDLLAVGTDGALHIVETKIGPDPMLVLQGLDYWTWAMAHRDELARYLSATLDVPVPEAPDVRLDFVVANAGAGFVSPYTAAQVEALDGSIPWECHTFAHWTTATPTVQSLGRRRSPDGPRVAAPRYAARLDGELTARAGSALHRRVFFVEHGAGVAPVARPAFDVLGERGLLHRFVDHVRSSQAFALNLFGDLKEDELRGIWAMIDPSVGDVGPIEFEYVDPADALAESQAMRPHQTQADVLLRGSAKDGTRHVALLEVKLSETRFGSCSAFDSPQNNRRDICRSTGPWGGDPAECFQLRNHGGPLRRRYDEYVQPAWVAPPDSECPFRELNQPMRNVALARALVDRNEADVAVFGLCAPLGNEHVWRQWRRVESLLEAVPGVRLHGLPVEQVLTALNAERRKFIADRYGLVAKEA